MNLISPSNPENSILHWWHRLSRVPAGSRLFSYMLGRMAPYSSSIKARIEQVETGYARVKMRDRKSVRNHLNSIHAIALINLGEIATGLAVLSVLPAEMRGIVVSIRADYLKKARGDLTAEAQFRVPDKFIDNTPCDVEARLCDEFGDVVTIVTATWLVGYRK